MANFKEVIENFLDGAIEGVSSGQGNLKIKGDVLIHYYTPILERYGEKYILNYSALQASLWVRNAAFLRN